MSFSSRPCFRELYSLVICFFNLRSSSLNSLWYSQIFNEDCLISFQILSFSFWYFSSNFWISSLISILSTLFSKNLTSFSSIKELMFTSILSLKVSILSDTFSKSSLIQERSGRTGIWVLTLSIFFSNFSISSGISDLIWSIISQSFSNSSS